MRMLCVRHMEKNDVYVSGPFIIGIIIDHPISRNWLFDCMGIWFIMFVLLLIDRHKENVKFQLRKIDVTITYGEKLKRKIRNLF